MLGFDGACGLGVGAFKQAERGLCHSCLTLSFPGTLLVPFLAVLPIMVRLRWLHFYLCRLCPQPPDPYIVGKLRLSAFCEFDDWEDDAAANVWVTFGANGKNLRGWEMMKGRGNMRCECRSRVGNACTTQVINGYFFISLGRINKKQDTVKYWSRRGLPFECNLNRILWLKNEEFTNK
jgi:hypothetical protein